MARLTLANLVTAIATLFADNTSGDISEADLRSVSTDIKDSFLHLDDFDAYEAATDAAINSKADDAATTAALEDKQNIAAAALTGTVIKFDQTAVYGTPSSPLTGNLTADLTGAKPGVRVCVVHKHTSEPTYGIQLKKKASSPAYTNSVNNYYEMTFMGGAIVMFNIEK
jgi:hypothetical protein